ncbi:MAG TPA: hypothetical protein VKV19_07215 [Ktedonobacteraceae bacterium]|jgi:hypothetical protein|nr:hypothetical protein [Ktedonobacteraceae bacterium]
MPICPLCDDTGLQNSDSTHPEFCTCAMGKQARREWQASRGTSRGSTHPRPASFIDISNLEDVNASVDAMRASLLGASSGETESPVRLSAASLLYQVAHAGHEVSVYEATQLYELAKALEGFLTALAPIGRNAKR